MDLGTSQRATGGRDPNHSDKRDLMRMNLGTSQRAQSARELSLAGSEIHLGERRRGCHIENAVTIVVLVLVLCIFYKV